MTNDDDDRIPKYIEATERLKKGDYDLALPLAREDEIGHLGRALQDLAHTLEARYRAIRKLNVLTSRINSGLLLDDILERVYADFKDIIPYNRIGFSLIEDGRTVRASWAKSDQPVIKIARGYTAPLAGSSLETIIKTGQPRILNDLRDYLQKKPHSVSTQLIVEEGIRSSLTCPLTANGVPVGFLFFSSINPNTYADVHVDIFKRIAEQLSVIVEKGRLVTEIAAQKLALEQQNQELIRLNEMKNSFLGTAAHDLRNPTGVIRMAAELLLDEGNSLSDEERKSFLTDILHQTNHMLALLNDLLDVTKIEAGRLDLKLERVELKGFLVEMCSRHTKLASIKGSNVTLESVPDGNVLVDTLRLRQVLDHLISNGVKYSPTGSCIRVRAERTQEGWQVRVQDQGPGISEDDQKKIFVEFARLPARSTDGERSTGLGLAIARRVMEAHGGRIGVDSQPGQGATFWFTLPE